MSRDSATVSNNMRKIHSKDTSIELLLRKALWHKGYRYRKNYKTLPGSPDIVLASGDISHLLSGENDQSQSDRNNQCISFSFL